MSSFASLTRSRSLRKPAPPGPDADATATARDNNAAAAAAGAGGGAAASSGTVRNASPSRLPVKPMTRSNTITAGSSSSGGSTTGARSARPISGMFGRSASTRQPRDARQAGTSGPDAAGPTAATRYVATTTASSSSSRYPPSASLTRPTTSGGLPGATSTKSRAPSHSRAKSNVTALSSATVLRPPSQQSSATGGPRPRPMSQHGPMRPPSRDASMMAMASTAATGRARPPSRDGPPPTSHSTAASSTSTASYNTAAASSSTAGATAPNPRLRPAFTTLQQHYSPARNLNPKPLTATFLAPPSPSKLPANVALSAETGRSQAELLRLHLLHRDAAAVDAAWRLSARGKLGARFAAVGAEAAEAEGREAERAERVNARALSRWGGGASSARPGAGATGGPAALDEMVQALDAVLSGLWTLGEPGGKHAKVVRRFERWAERVAEVEDARRRRQQRHDDGGGGGGSGGEDELLLGDDGEVVFVGDLGRQWKDECAAMARRLEGWRGQLALLGEVPGEAACSPAAEMETDGGGGSKAGETSSLGRVLGACRELVDGMLAELDVMERIEADALRRETEWTRRMNRDEGPVDAPRAGAIWRAL